MLLEMTRFRGAHERRAYVRVDLASLLDLYIALDLAFSSSELKPVAQAGASRAEEWRRAMASDFDRMLAVVASIVPAQRGAPVDLRRISDSSRPSISHRKEAKKGGLQLFKLRRVREHMQANLAERFALAPLAEIAGLSEYHFSRVFKQSTGLSPSRYFVRLRLAQAKRLLRETDCSIIQIAMAVGYRSPSHFSRVFRQAVGVAPSDFR